MTEQNSNVPRRNPIEEVYIQSVDIKPEKEKGLMVVGRRRMGLVAKRGLVDDIYSVYLYELTRETATLLEKRRFDRGTKEENYRAMQECVKRVAGAEAVFYDGETIEGPFSRSMEHIAKEHLSLN